MPGVQIEERCDKVEAKGGSKCNNDDSSSIAAKERFKEVACIAIGVEFGSCRIGERSDNEENRQNNQIQLNKSENYKRRDVCPTRTV